VSDGATSLEQVLADWAERIAVLVGARAMVPPETLEHLRADVARAAEPYTRRLSERDAEIYSGRRVRWLRRMFPEWEAQGNAGRDAQGRRWYRMAVLPRAVPFDALRRDASKTAAEDAA